MVSHVAVKDPCANVEPKQKSSLFSKGSNKEEKLKNLKKEVEMDEHMIPLAELCNRLHTHPQKVGGRPRFEQHVDIQFF